MTRRIAFGIVLAVAGFARAAEPRPVWITGATVHTVSGREIPDGAVLLEGGKIAGVGRPPASLDADADRVDAAGLHLYPGLIDCNTVLGLTEIGAVRATLDIDETGTVTPNLRAELAVNPDSELLAVTRANGVLAFMTSPRGGRISGLAALMRLDGWTWTEMTVKAPVGLHLNWPNMRIDRRPDARRKPEEQEKERDEALQAIRDAFAAARAYGAARRAAAAGEGPPVAVDARWEAMLPVLAGEVPAIVTAAEIAQIEAAIEWAEKEGVRMILSGGDDAWRAAGKLAEKKIPVLLDPALSLPRRDWEPYDTAYRNAARLHEAGVAFCFSEAGGSGFGAANTRNLPYNAAMAEAFGLPHDAAIRALTLSPAEILGVADRLGSIDEGKDATLILTDGDPLDIRTNIVRAWIDGREVDLSSRHTRLWERYRDRPRPSP
jgi:imidazolonepropionase-like amidohydrolase